VYASGEDITDPALDETGRFHTNFGLRASGGEDLVLSCYDMGLGQYVPVTEYLDFPEQERDISFGLYEAKDVTPIAPAHSVADIIVPTGPIPSWYTETYAPSGWMVGETGVGFENTVPGIFTTLYKANSGVYLDNLSLAEAMIANPSQQAAVYTDVAAWINYYESGGTGREPDNQEPFPGNTVGEDYATVSVGEVTITTPGQYTFNVNSDDGFRLTIDGASVTGVYLDGAPPPAPTGLPTRPPAVRPTRSVRSTFPRPAPTRSNSYGTSAAAGRPLSFGSLRARRRDGPRRFTLWATRPRAASKSGTTPVPAAVAAGTPA
ncbi:MAG: hypothetical protein U9R68_10085, partial [Planctomycetota bacterium]|nr:hypothetical protein [Planctomycetota bacterium]